MKNLQIDKTSKTLEPKQINNFKILKRVGFGSSGFVYKVIKKDDVNNKPYILKQIPYSEQSLEETTKKVNSARNEALILSKLSCKYIVKYYDSFVDSDLNLNIIMEYCDNGDLNTFIQNQKKLKKYLPEKDIWNFFIQISLGLAYIHSKKILHRDLKPMNIFLTKKNEIKIGDLGVAKFLSTNSIAMTCIGTPYYLSPEICKEKPYNSKGDVWALGCILYELCTFEKPFSASNPAALILKIISGNYIPLNEINNGMKYSPELEKMIEVTLQKDYLIRPLMIDIIKSKIFEEKALLHGFKDDLINIRNLYQNNDNFENVNPQGENNLIDKEEMNSKSETNIYNKKIKNIKNKEIINRNNININFIINSGKKSKGNQLINPKSANINNIYKKNNRIINNNKNNDNKKDVPYIHSIKTKLNYLTSGKPTNDSSYNNESNIHIINNNNSNTNKFNNIKVKQRPKQDKKYTKYITEKGNKNLDTHQILADKNKYSDKKGNKNNRENLMNTRLKMFKISPIHYRDCSGGKNRKISLMNKDNIIVLDNISTKNRRVHSGEKKYINKAKNDIYNKRKKNINKNNNEKIGNAYNPFRENILYNNIRIKNINNINNININNMNYILSKNNYSQFLTNSQYQNMSNKHNINHINNINNININYSLNLIEKTRSNFYSNKYERFVNMKPPNDSIKMYTQNNFNNLHQFRIENGFEDTENYKSLKSYEINNKNKYCNTPESSNDDSECNVESNLNDEENILDDSEQENDENEEEKVCMVKEEDNAIEDEMDKRKQIIQKYNEFKNQIMKYKNDIDIKELFSMYEKMSQNKIKIEEIDEYMKNNLSGEKHDKFRKLFKQFIFYDVELQNLNNL